MLPKIHIDIERWKYSPKYKCYVSNMGHIKTKEGKDRKLQITDKGYMRFKYRNEDGKQKGVFVHRVVMETWCPCENMDELTVDHLNHNKRDNSVKNLEWVSYGENQRRAREDYKALDLTDIEVQKDIPYIKFDGKIITKEELDKFINDNKFTNEQKANLDKKIKNILIKENRRFTYFGHIFSPLGIEETRSEDIGKDYYIRVNNEFITKHEFDVLCHAIPLCERANFITKVDIFRRSDKASFKYGYMIFSKV